MDQQYLTSKHLAELKNNLGELKAVKRLAVAERLKRAKELGDLSENSEYFEAREEQEQVERRIVELETMIKNAALIKKSSGHGIVEIGSTLIVLKGDEQFKFTIVGSSEARPEAGFISNESPLGRAFLGKKEKEEVAVKTPGGEVAYKIVKIE